MLVVVDSRIGLVTSGWRLVWFGLVGLVLVGLVGLVCLLGALAQLDQYIFCGIFNFLNKIILPPLGQVIGPSFGMKIKHDLIREISLIDAVNDVPGLMKG